jgi:beta-lactamase family protein
VATAEDLGHYLTMQLGDGTYQGHRLLSPASMRLLHERRVTVPAADPDPYTDGYALGWYTGAVNGTPLVSHSGDVTGFHNDIGLLPTRHTALAVLTAQNSKLLANDDAYVAGMRVLAGQPAPAIGFLRQYRNRYLLTDPCFPVLLLAMAWRWTRLIRHPRPASARRAIWGLAGSLTLGALVYAAVVYGIGYTAGFPLQPDLLLGGAPELLAAPPRRSGRHRTGQVAGRPPGCVVAACGCGLARSSRPRCGGGAPVGAVAAGHPRLSRAGPGADRRFGR